MPVIDHWWQTETAWPIAANCVGLGMLPVKPGSPTKPVPGYDVRVLGEDNQEMPAGEIGSIALRLPLPPGCLPTLWNNDDGYEQSYLTKHPGHYLTGDAGYKDADGYVYIMSRVDDIINVAGHRLSTGAMEEVLAAHPDVAECAVVGVADEIKGEVPVGLRRHEGRGRARRGRDRPGARGEGARADRAGRRVQDRARRPAAAQDALGQDPARDDARRSPTASRYAVPATIDDPAILDEITAALGAKGYPKNVTAGPVTRGATATTGRARRRR